MIDLQYDIGHLLSASVLVLSFALLFQRRILGVLRIFALQASVLAAAAAWQAWIQDAPHLYVTAAIALLFKAIAIPVTLQRIVVRLGIHRTVETVLGVGLAMLAGVGLVALSILLVLPVTHAAIALTRDDLALALSVVLLGLLMMITRRNAVTQVVGFMSLENGLILAAVGVRGMPLVVEMSVAFSVMVAFIIFGIFFFHIRERFDTLDLQYLETFRGERRMSPIALILGIPLVAGIVLALIPGKHFRLAARLNIAASAATLVACLSLLWVRPALSLFFFIDDFNVYLVVLTAFVGFTTSWFSATYIAHEVETGRLDALRLRFYHGMYQAFMLTMLLALVANNLGLMWVAVEGATLATANFIAIEISLTQIAGRRKTL